MAIAYTTVAGATAITIQSNWNLLAKLKGYLATKGFQASHNMYQRALRYNPNTIVTYPTTPNTIIYIGYCTQLYKSYYNIAAGLLLHYKIS